MPLPGARPIRSEWVDGIKIHRCSCSMNYEHKYREYVERHQLKPECDFYDPVDAPMERAKRRATRGKGRRKPKPIIDTSSDSDDFIVSDDEEQEMEPVPKRPRRYPVQSPPAVSQPVVTPSAQPQPAVQNVDQMQQQINDAFMAGIMMAQMSTLMERVGYKIQAPSFAEMNFTNLANVASFGSVLGASSQLGSPTNSLGGFGSMIRNSAFTCSAASESASATAPATVVASTSRAARNFPVPAKKMPPKKGKGKGGLKRKPVSKTGLDLIPPLFRFSRVVLNKLSPADPTLLGLKGTLFDTGKATATTTANRAKPRSRPATPSNHEDDTVEEGETTREVNTTQEEVEIVPDSPASKTPLPNHGRGAKVQGKTTLPIDLNIK